MFPIILERDTTIIEWQAYRGWCTVFTNLLTETLTVRSDGLVHPDYAVLDTSETTGTVTARATNCMGVHLTGPEPGAEHTCYQIAAICATDDPLLRPFLFIGESDTITSAVTGNLVTDIRILEFGTNDGLDGNSLKSNMTIATPVNTADKTICIGVGLMAGVANAVNLGAWLHIAVRRLVGVNPQVLDTRKL